ncbi:MAG: hypothetical protein GYB65_13545 [Chloroflexi bacterium]|nr:hypothetical protein [Chloroflexota bacterium]
MQGKRVFLFPLIFVLVTAPVAIYALVTFTPDSDCDCECSTAANVAPHSHGYGLVSSITDDMQLIFNVTPAAELYQLNDDGRLELCGDIDVSAEMKHITIDVNDAALSLGERLPVSVTLTIVDAATGNVLVSEQNAPAMYAQGHGYHFGDNYLVPNGTTYDWTVTVSPVTALRQPGVEDLWTEPVTWEGSFALAEDGTVTQAAAAGSSGMFSSASGGVITVGDFIAQGLHVTLVYEDRAIPLVAADGTAQGVPDGSRYFVVDVTDHQVNFEEKLPGAEVVLVFERDSSTLEVTADPVISPLYGFHYGANVALEPGEWSITVEVAGLAFRRHAGSTVNLGRSPISETFTLAVSDG